jgi:hypothetical protein
MVVACGNDSGQDGSMGGSAGALAGDGAGVSAGGGGAGGAPGAGTHAGGSAGSAGGAADPFMGVGEACETFDTPLQNAPRGLMTFHANVDSTSFFDVGTRVLTFKAGLFYVVEDDVLKTIDLAGAVTELGPAPEGDPTVIDDYYYFSESSAVDQNKVDHWVSPFLMPEQKTPLAQTEATLLSEIGEGLQFWEVRGAAPAIWSAPFTGGDGMELVPGGQPTGLVVEAGYLYWTDFQSGMLERVPVAGGPREPLATITFGGLMSAGFGAFYWAGPTGQLYRWKPGGEEEHVFLATTGHKAATPVPVDGGAYFSAGGFTCQELYTLSLAGKPELLLSGFEEFVRVVGITTEHLYVQDKKAIYRLDR